MSEDSHRDPLAPAEQRLKGGRNAVSLVWAAAIGIAVVGVLLAALFGRRPLSGTGSAASVTPGPAGIASGDPSRARAAQH